MIKIIDLPTDKDGLIEETAVLLINSFGENWVLDKDSALEEVHESLGNGRISRIALNEQGQVVGWVAAEEQYDGRVWEIHPLAVSPAHQGQGIGRALMHDLEKWVAARGGLTLWLGTDDETGATSLSGVDLYPNVWEHIGRIRNLHRHPYEFYQKLGFVITGVVPDANGVGKPDILMAKRVNHQT